MTHFPCIAYAQNLRRQSAGSDTRETPSSPTDEIMPDGDEAQTEHNPPATSTNAYDAVWDELLFGH